MILIMVLDIIIEKELVPSDSLPCGNSQAIRLGSGLASGFIQTA
jgi:hypothetical protein